MLKFTRGNAKLDALESIVGGQVWTFSLLAGHTCPYAKLCLSKAIRHNGKTTIQDGPHTQFRCFSASEETMYPNVYNSHSHNSELLLDCDETSMTDSIGTSIPTNAKCIRVHVSGDYFNQLYFNAWMNVAREYKDILFYSYTKSLPFWVEAKTKKAVPPNFILTASRGGWKDSLIRRYKLRQAIVISDVKTCEAIVASGQSDYVVSGRYKGYAIDHDDSLACLPEYKNQSFALLVHGTMPKNSEAAKAKQILGGIGSYSKKSRV